jgi:hypothetical protein
MKLIRLFAAIIVALLLVAAWASDFVTLQGERTTYTAKCEGGEWQRGACTGKMVAGNRYRYRAAKKEGEVFLQIIGSSRTSRTLVNCNVRDGRNWTCPQDDSIARTWTTHMENGTPVIPENSSARSERRVSKWRWFVLHAADR